MKQCWSQEPEKRPSFTELKARLDELMGERPEEYLACGDPEAPVLDNINSDDNHEMDQRIRYSFLSTVEGRNDISSLFVQGYDRIADAHSDYGTLVAVPPMSEIKSNPIPETYQHLPVIEPAYSDEHLSACRKDSNQYVNHILSPIFVKPDFDSENEGFLTQKL